MGHKVAWPMLPASLVVPSPSPLRLRLATALYALALVVLGVGLASVVAGAWQLEWGPLRMKVGSWKLLRTVVGCLVLGLAVDPLREERLARAAAWFEARHRWLLGGGLVAAGAYLVSFKVRQQLSFHTGAYDLSMFHHAVHNTVHGSFMHAFGIERSFFSEHFSPLLLALVPLYAVAPSPLSLLVVQALAVSAACVPLYLLARDHGLARPASTLVTAAFLFSSVLWRGFAFDFHVELLGVPLVFTAALALHRRRWGLYYLAALGALFVKEDMVLVVGALAVLALDRERRWHALATWVLCAVWGYLAWKVAIPLSYPDARTTSHFVERYGHLGNGYGGILWGLVSRPGFVLGRIFSAPMWGLLGSTAMLPVLDPLSLVLALPSLLVHLVSGYAYQADLKAYYGLNGALFLWMALPRALQRLQSWTSPRAAAFAGLAALASGAAAPFPDRAEPRHAWARAALGQVDTSERISAMSPLLPHLAPSRSLLLFPERTGAQLLLLDLDGWPWPLEREAFYDEVRELLSGGEYGVEVLHEGYLFLRRGADTARNAEALRALEQSASAHAARR